jgi:hypothetical protein
VRTVEFGGDVGQLRLDEREAGRVFDGLGACVDSQVVAPDECLDAFDRGRVEAVFGQQDGDVAGMALALVALPAQVAGLAGVVAAAG